MTKSVLITGATGKQGGSVVDALLAAPQSKDFTILALTRNTASPAAQTLASRAENVKVVQGDLNDIPAIFKAALAAHPEPIWGLFSVQVPMGKGQTTETEEKQGKELIDEALKQGVKQFVYTSIERHGEKSYENATPVPHFISKHNIEHHLVDSSKGGEGAKMGWTIIRPVAFMENFNGFFGKMFGAMWQASLKPNQTLQLVSVTDIGHFAAQAFINPEKNSHREINLAGDELTWQQVNAAFQERTGSAAPATWAFLGSGLLWGVKEVGTMFKWFADEGYGADVQMLKREHEGLMTLGDWIEKKSAFAKK